MNPRTLLALLILAPFATPSAFAALVRGAVTQGTTANGCSYQVINGKYTYSCETKSEEPAAPVAQAPAPVVAPAAATATPSVSPAATAPIMPIVIGEPSDQSAKYAREESEAPTFKSHKKVQSEEAGDSLYGGAFVGNSTMTSLQSGSTGIGLLLGTDIDENLALEFTYSYAKQDLQLGLADRPGSSLAANKTTAANDSDLHSHLLGAEAIYHLTELGRRLRPYGGLGLAWRSATLSEDLPYATAYNPYGYGATVSQDGAQLNQKSWGTILSLGTKLRFTERLQLMGAFRYYLPLSHQTAELSGPNGRRLNSSDADTIGSSQYQLVAGLQLFF